jgi:hypothetical protein
MEWGTILALATGGLIVLFPVAFIWYVNVGGILTASKSRGVVKKFKEAPSNLTCSIDNDCPQGFVCLNRRCVPAR